MTKQQPKEYTVWAVIDKNKKLIATNNYKYLSEDLARIMMNEIQVETNKFIKPYKIKKATLII